MPTLREHLHYLDELKHQLAVWEAAFSYLDDNFISKDGREAKGIRAPGSLDELVAEGTIEGVMKVLSDEHILKLKTEIEALESQDLVLKKGAGR